MVPYRGRWMQVGITSFGTNICYQPTAFARVSSLVDYPFGAIPPERSGSWWWTGAVGNDGRGELRELSVVTSPSVFSATCVEPCPGNIMQKCWYD